jgi:hypothetical protein
MIIDNTLLHLTTLLYLNLDEFDYDYDLLVKVFNKIIDNYIDFAFVCSINEIYKDIDNLNPDNENIINEYLLCKDILKCEFKPAIKVKKI